MYKNKNIAIIGGGIIGLAVAYKLSEQGAFVHVFEKEEALDYINRDEIVVYYIVAFIINLGP